MKLENILARIRATQAPLVRQLLMVAWITRGLAERGKPPPVLIGGLALSYYTREVYFTADIDLAYHDRDALGDILRETGFSKEGRYWIHAELDMAVEVSASSLPGEEAPREVVDLGDGLSCVVIGIEDLIIDRMNACMHWKSEIDCEMTELLIAHYRDALDWDYLERKAALPENETLEKLREFRSRTTP